MMLMVSIELGEINTTSSPAQSPVGPLKVKR